MFVKPLFLSIAPVMATLGCVLLVSCESLRSDSEEDKVNREAQSAEQSETQKPRAKKAEAEIVATPDEAVPEKKGLFGWMKRGLDETKPEAAQEKEAVASEKEEVPGKDKPLDLGPDANQLLAMSFEEAKAISPQSLVVPPSYRIAADEIQILQSDSIGRPLKVRAKGKVFLQIDFQERLIALSQEAYIESRGESIVRGRPLLKRGKSVIEGLSDYAVFYIQGSRLQAIGKHRILKQEFGYVPSRAVGSSSSGNVNPPPMPIWNVTPNWNRAWQDGPNPLLPALSPQDVPADLRATPLLPPVDEGADLPPPPPTHPPEVQKEGKGGDKKTDSENAPPKEAKTADNAEVSQKGSDSKPASAEQKKP